MRCGIQLLAVLFFIFARSTLTGQNLRNCAESTKNADGTVKTVAVACNGISVGLPKVFDNRTLTLQLQKLQQQLNQQQAKNSLVDLKSIAAALNNLQGLSQQETSTAVSVTASPTPATSLSSTLATGNVDSNGNPLPNTTNTQNQTSTSSVTPAAPAFDSFATLPTGFNPTFGPNASDMINDQVNLSYQIVNLQMLLDRALSDRIYPHDETGETRLQTVLGLNVTLDPPRTANDAVAVVEVTVTPTPTGEISLVALMPQEKTYNAAALSSKSNAYSGAAMAGAFQISGGVRKRSQVFYLYKDVDTLSYERMGQNGTIVFGWMFRPVLGRRSVPPGFKQLFAVLALPCKDKEVCGAVNLTSSVRTYWKKYDRNTQTSFEREEVNRARDVWYGLSLGTAKPQLFSHGGYENDREYGPVRVGTTDEYQQQLTPTVTNVDWRPTGNKTATISVKGNNFFTDTQVLLGDHRYSEAGGNMAIKSDRSLELTSTLDQIAGGLGVILGRYGLSTSLTNIGAPKCRGTCAFGVAIDEEKALTVSDAAGGLRRLTVTLRAIPDPQRLFAKTEDKGSLLLSSLLAITNTSLTSKGSDDGATQTPVISVNGTVVPFPYDIVQLTKPDRIQISTDVSDTLLIDTSASVIKVAWPFYNPEKWSTSVKFTPPDSQFSATRISDNTIILSRTNGASFVPATTTTGHCWTLIATEKPLSFGTSDCSATRSPTSSGNKKRKPSKKKTDKKAEIKKPSVTPIFAPGQPAYSFLVTLPSKFPAKVLLLDTQSAIYHVNIPDLTEKKDTATKVTTLQQYDSSWIDIAYPANKVPFQVETNGVSLKWRIDPPDPKAKADAAAKKTDKTLHVEITRSETAKPGLLDLVVFDKTQAQIVKQQVRVTCTLCGEGGYR